MAETTKTPENQGSEKSSYFKSPMHLLVLILILFGLFVIAVYVSRHNKSTKSQSSTVKTETLSTAKASLLADNTKPAAGSNVAITVWEDSGSQSVNAVRTYITYPGDKLEFVSVDTSNSAFEVQAQNVNQNNEVMLVRGHTGSLTGRQQIATINFKVKDQTGTANLAFTKDTAVLSSVTNQNILGQSSSVDLTIGSNQ